MTYRRIVEIPDEATVQSSSSAKAHFGQASHGTRRRDESVDEEMQHYTRVQVLSKKDPEREEADFGLANRGTHSRDESVDEETHDYTRVYVLSRNDRIRLANRGTHSQDDSVNEEKHHPSRVQKPSKSDLQWVVVKTPGVSFLIHRDTRKGLGDEGNFTMSEAKRREGKERWIKRKERRRRGIEHVDSGLADMDI